MIVYPSYISVAIIKYPYINQLKEGFYFGSHSRVQSFIVFWGVMAAETSMPTG